VVSRQAYFYDLVTLCDDWRLGKKLSPKTKGYDGYRLSDMSSCPPRSSVDPVFNIMEYTADSCYSHFTPAQASPSQ
jgi:hypothetical protein